MTRRDLSAPAEAAVLALVLGIAALVSYTHLRAVWVHAGSPWPELGPLLVDGLFASAWLRMRRRRRQDEPVGGLAWVALGLALVATLAGNVAAAHISGHTSLLAYVVAAWPAVAFALVWELVTGHGRPIAQPAGEPPAEEVAAPPAEDETADDKAARLIRAGYGRGRLAAELEISQAEARALIDKHRQLRVAK